MSIDKPTHCVAVFGAATAGSTAAEILAEQGVQVVVFEQNARPYGKIEDGLPRWHDKQRRKEYGRIDARLSHPNVTYVPQTKLGEDVDFVEVARDWGFSAVILANGAWKDRPFPVENADEGVDKGLVYQNSFIYWFNHKCEAAYDGPQYEVPEHSVVVGGGLASIDCIKIIQLELYERALRARGVEDLDMIEMEHKGIPRYCEMKGVGDPASLGVKPGILLYRRRVIDMPLASAPPGAPQKAIDRLPATREKILTKAMEKYLFETRDQTLPTRLVVEGDRVTGLEVVKTQVEGRRATPVEGSEEVIPCNLVVSSVGSIPEPIPGVEMDGTYYKFVDEERGTYGPIPGVFGVGNVITGQGNIKVSLDHGKQVAGFLVESYLGAGEGEGERDLSEAFARGGSKGEGAAEAVAQHLETRAPLEPTKVAELLARAHARQQEVGYESDYGAWIQKVTPPDLQ